MVKPRRQNRDSGLYAKAMSPDIHWAAVPLCVQVGEVGVEPVVCTTVSAMATEIAELPEPTIWLFAARRVYPTAFDNESGLFARTATMDSARAAVALAVMFVGGVNVVEAAALDDCTAVCAITGVDVDENA